MRLWSIHPKYLDAKGLTAVWREGLLAKAVLEGKTDSYKNHPQLARFKMQKNPTLFVTSYLYEIYNEAERRGYSFDRNKLGRVSKIKKIAVNNGQIKYEFSHLMKKLSVRNRKKYSEIRLIKRPMSHPSFLIKNGSIEPWEKV